MTEYLEKMLHMRIHAVPEKQIIHKLPLEYQGMYAFFRMETEGADWIAVKPVCDIGLVRLRKII